MAAGQSSSSILDSVWRWVRATIICAASLSACACSSGGEAPERAPDTGPPAISSDPDFVQLPFLVDDYYVPSGCFGDDNCQGAVLEIDNRACRDRLPTTQSVCRRYTYTPLAADAAGFQGFLGILFQDVGDRGESGIGKVPGLPIQPGAKRVSFLAAVGSGSLPVEFRAGGANNWEGQTDPSLPFKDEFGVGVEVVLDTKFQAVEIDLSGVTYTDVVSPFGWAIESNGRTDAIELFIDDLRWE